MKCVICDEEKKEVTDSFFSFRGVVCYECQEKERKRISGMTKAERKKERDEDNKLVDEEVKKFKERERERETRRTRKRKVWNCLWQRWYKNNRIRYSENMPRILSWHGFRKCAI